MIIAPPEMKSWLRPWLAPPGINQYQLLV